MRVLAPLVFASIAACAPQTEDPLVHFMSPGVGLGVYAFQKRLWGWGLAKHQHTGFWQARA